MVPCSPSGRAWQSGRAPETQFLRTLIGSSVGRSLRLDSLGPLLEAPLGPFKLVEAPESTQPLGFLSGRLPRTLSIRPHSPLRAYGVVQSPNRTESCVSIHGKPSRSHCTPGGSCCQRPVSHRTMRCCVASAIQNRTAKQKWPSKSSRLTL